jgi:signal transduction histidine kinase
LWIESPEDRNTRYPHLSDTYLGLGVGALAGVPMILNGKTLGALVFHFVGKRSFDIDDRTLLFTLATQCAQALERARPYEAEQTARAAADATAHLWAYLARAGQTLAHSLDFDETLETAAKVVIPYLADFSLIFVIESGNVRGAAFAHRQHEKQPDVEIFAQLFHPNSGSMDCPTTQVILTDQSKLFDDWKDARCVPTTPAAQQAVDTLTPRSMMLVPLTVRGRAAGVFVLVSAESERHYTENDLALAEEIAHRIALAAENARLYAEAQAQSTELEGRVQTRTEQLRDSHAQLQQLSARLEHLREEERTQIAREVHDELGGSLTSIKMGLVRLRKESANDKPEWTERINELTGLVDSTVQTVRRIASDLRPAILDELGLLPALEWQAQEFERRSGLTCNFQNSFPEDNELRLDKETTTAIFRVFQESLTNIARHAQASQIDASVQRDGQELVLQVHDNGLGIETVKLNNSKSLGLAGMRERMRQVAGQFDIRGEKGEGTTVLIRIPLNLL